MDIKTTLLLVAVALHGVLALAMLARSRRTFPVIMFALAIVALMFWALGHAILETVVTHQYLLPRLPYLSASLIVSFFFIFSLTFPQKNLRRSQLLWVWSVGTLNALILVLLFFPEAIIQSVAYDAEGFREILFKPLFVVYGIYIVGLFVAAFFILIHKIRRSSGILRTQFLYIFSGSFLAALVGVSTNLILPAFGNFEFFWLGPVVSIVFSLLTVYAILRHHLLNIRVIGTEIFTGLIVTVFLVEVIFAETMRELILSLALFLLVLLFGVFLIRGTLRELRVLQELSDVKSEFISIASHQLRTPLSAIKGYISMILEGTYGDTTPQQKEALQKVYASNERLVRLVNDLLNVSRIEQGRLTYTYARTSMPQMIESIVSELQISAKFKNVELRWQNPQNAEKFITWADENKLRQSVLNLVDNAIKYTEKGFVEVRIEQDINPTLMRISVRDTGVGLSFQDKEKIFKRFSRGSDSSKLNAGGSGLGLFVAKKMVEDHRGHIWAESAGPGKGSTFIITLPFYKEKSV